jgi:hypothetical protein
LVRSKRPGCAPENCEEKLAASKCDGLFWQVSWLKQAPPPSRKIITLVEAGLRLMPTPVAEPSRQCASGKSTQVHCSVGSPVMATPVVPPLPLVEPPLPLVGPPLPLVEPTLPVELLLPAVEVVEPVDPVGPLLLAVVDAELLEPVVVVVLPLPLLELLAAVVELEVAVNPLEPEALWPPVEPAAEPPMLLVVMPVEEPEVLGALLPQAARAGRRTTTSEWMRMGRT